MAKSERLKDAGVSEREAEVLALVGDHLTNAQIAASTVHLGPDPSRATCRRCCASSRSPAAASWHSWLRGSSPLSSTHFSPWSGEKRIGVISAPLFGSYSTRGAEWGLAGLVVRLEEVIHRLRPVLAPAQFLAIHLPAG